MLFETEDIKRMPIELNEAGKPLPDGYTRLYVDYGPEVIDIPWKDYRFDETHPTYFRYGDTKRDPGATGFGEFNCIIPWARIYSCVTIYNSDDYVQAMEYFRSMCNHVYDEDKHQLLGICHHVCMLCDKVEEIQHEDS